MMVIGLTGSMGSGKSTIAAMLEKAGVAIIDADVLAREASNGAIVLKEIKERFGPQVLDSGILNRKALAQQVFNDRKALLDLEKIMHPVIEKLYYHRLENLKKAGCELVVYVVPLLFEKKLEHRVDKTLLVVASEEKLLQRIMARDGISEHDARLRLSAQMTNEEKIKKADAIIINNGNIEKLFGELKIEFLRLCNKDLNSK